MASPMALGRRDIGSTIDGVKESFSSWDACMSKAYCNNQQYQSAPPMYAGPGWNQNNNVPQYATFDSGNGDKKFNEDALPEMPTWDTAKSTKVEVFEEPVKEHPGDMELQKLDMKPGESPTNSSVGPTPINTRSPAPPSDYGMPIQPQPIHPATASLAIGNIRSPSPYQSDYHGGPDQAGYFNGPPQQPYGMQGHASPSPYQDQNQPYAYASDPYGQNTYGYDHGGAPYGQQYDTASSVGGYAPSQAPTGYAPSGSTRYEPSMHNAYQDPYQRQPPPPMPPIDRAGTASPYQMYGQPPRPPIDRVGTASPYQPFNNGPRPPVERSATGSPWERLGANRNMY
ncbi:hypothetical protein SLS55_004029 [Diplodia seriata]|uniref:Uncharacterized protein n=1 Tax=Diplodia seriata TaxID=420778 RepID=A0ABR3CIA3_9PEZI